MNSTWSLTARATATAATVTVTQEGGDEETREEVLVDVEVEGAAEVGVTSRSQ